MDQKDSDALKGRVLKDLLDASSQERKDFESTGDEVMNYSHKADQEQAMKALGVQAELWFQMTVALTSQAVDLMCPYLYPANPYRCGHVRRKGFADPQQIELSKARNGLMVEYLNYTPEECGLYEESVRAINESLPYGAGVLWTGFDEKKGLVTSAYDSIKNLYLDPDATSDKQSRFKIRKRQSVRWELMDQFPDKATQILKIKADSQRKSQMGKSNDLVSWYEAWFMVGLHRYADGKLSQTVGEDGIPVQATDQPRKYFFTEDGLYLGEGKWECPLFLDNLWPCEMVSFIDDQDSIYPVSPLRAALPFQRALNWLFIFYMTKIRFCSRSIFAFLDDPAAEMGSDSKKMLEMFDDLPIVSIRADSSKTKLNDIFQQLNLDPGIENFERAHAILKREFQEHSGVYDILHYGESETQDRSATATNFKDKTSKTRINYRLDRVIKWQGRIARKEAMYARFIHTPEQIDVILGQGAGALWGQVMPPNASAANPLAVDFRQWYLETDYSIEATSMRRHDVEAKIDGMQELMTRTAPEQLKSPDPTEKALAYDAAAEYYELIGASDEIVKKYQDFAEYLRQQAQLMMQAQEQQAQMGQQQAAADQQMQQQQMQDQQQAQQSEQQMAQQKMQMEHQEKMQDQATNAGMQQIQQQIQQLMQVIESQGKALEGIQQAEIEQAKQQAVLASQLQMQMQQPMARRRLQVGRNPETNLIESVSEEGA